MWESAIDIAKGNNYAYILYSNFKKGEALRFVCRKCEAA